MPPKPRLTPEISEQVCAIVATGGYLATAGSRLGIPHQTLDDWRAIGEGRHARRPQREPYISFAKAVAEAEANSELSCIQRMREAGRGGRQWEEQIIEEKFGAPTRDPETGEMVPRLLSRTVKRIQKIADRIWQADAWLLERRFGQRWRRRDTTAIELPAGGYLVEVPPKESDKEAWMRLYRPGGVPRDWNGGGNGRDASNGGVNGPTGGNGSGNGEDTT
jgi:hypothetical protein